LQVKICGIKSEKDLKTCENNDIAFIGFIHIKRSQRFVDIDKIKELKGKMKNPEKAVLVLEPLNALDAMEKAEKCGIKYLQLHSLSASEIDHIKRVNIIRAIGIPDYLDDKKIREIENIAGVCNYLLFDSEAKGRSGGTGKQIPLKTVERAAETAKTINGNIKIFLAGGMNSKRMKNEGKIIKRVFDYVDVNSGVEDKPGIKNETKIKEFIETCKVNI
jgi:phosphoribosylanthranilate isomerase